jgi:hypothetical protein
LTKRGVSLSVQARAVGRHQKGAVVGLRQTGQRLLDPDPAGHGRDRRPFRHEPKLPDFTAFMLALCGPLALIILRLHGPAAAMPDH